MVFFAFSAWPSSPLAVIYWKPPYINMPTAINPARLRTTKIIWVITPPTVVPPLKSVGRLEMLGRNSSGFAAKTWYGTSSKNQIAILAFLIILYTRWIEGDVGNHADDNEGEDDYDNADHCIQDHLLRRARDFFVTE